MWKEAARDSELNRTAQPQTRPGTPTASDDQSIHGFASNSEPSMTHVPVMSMKAVMMLLVMLLVMVVVLLQLLRLALFAKLILTN